MQACVSRLVVHFGIWFHYFPFFWPFVVENSGSDNIKSAMVVPSPTVRDRVLKELFIDGM